MHICEEKWKLKRFKNVKNQNKLRVPKTMIKLLRHGHCPMGNRNVCCPMPFHPMGSFPWDSHGTNIPMDKPVKLNQFEYLLLRLEISKYFCLVNLEVSTAGDYFETLHCMMLFHYFIIRYWIQLSNLAGVPCKILLF